MQGFLVTFDGDYKAQKEEWVTGYTGTSGAEVAAVVATVPVRRRPPPSEGRGGPQGKCARQRHHAARLAHRIPHARVHAGLRLP